VFADSAESLVMLVRLQRAIGLGVVVFAVGLPADMSPLEKGGRVIAPHSL